MQLTPKAVTAFAALIVAARAAATAFAIMIGAGVLYANSITSGTLSFAESLGLAGLIALATFKAELTRD